MSSVEYPLNLNSKGVPLDLRKLNSVKVVKTSLFDIRKSMRRNSSVVDKKEDIILVLRGIMPKVYFGSNNNKKLFFKLVGKILSQRKHEFIHVSLLYKGFDNSFVWSKNVANSDFVVIVTEVNKYLLEKCVKPFIKKHFISISRGKSYKIDLIAKPKWHSFKHRIFLLMKLEKHMKVDCQSAKFQPRGALRILPKKDCDCLSYRPVITYFKKSESKEINLRITNIKNKLKRYLKSEKCCYQSVHETWKKFTVKQDFRRIYGIKADVEDAFGSINIDELSGVIQEVPKEFLNGVEKKFLHDHIKTQYVSFKKNIVMKWCHGLLQGDRLSSVLCDLYYSMVVDKKLLKNFEGHYFFHRTVDDYIFCSTDEKNVELFHSKLSQELVLNKTKIYTNLGNNQQVELPYCGYIFNLNTKEIWIGVDLKYNVLSNRFKLWNKLLYTNPDGYLTNIMKLSSASFYFSGTIFNTHFNSEETILKVYFTSMIYLGFKFDCAFLELQHYHLNYTQSFPIVSKKVLFIIKQYARKSFNIIKKHKGRLFNNDIKFDTLVTVGAHAFILVFQKRSPVYRDIIRILKRTVTLRINLFGGLDISYFKKIPII